MKPFWVGDFKLSYKFITRHHLISDALFLTRTLSTRISFWRARSVHASIPYALNQHVLKALLKFGRFTLMLSKRVRNWCVPNAQGTHQFLMRMLSMFEGTALLKIRLSVDVRNFAAPKYFLSQSFILTPKSPMYRWFWKFGRLFFIFGQITFWAIYRDILRGPRLFWPSEYPLKWPINYLPAKKIISRIFKISDTFIVTAHNLQII